MNIHEFELKPARLDFAASNYRGGKELKKIDGRVYRNKQKVQESLTSNIVFGFALQNLKFDTGMKVQLLRGLWFSIILPALILFSLLKFPFSSSRFAWSGEPNKTG